MNASVIFRCLTLISAVTAASLSVAASGKVFFAADDIIFAEPDPDFEGSRPGDGVVVVRPGRAGRSEVVARGGIFRRRPEHVVIRLTEGVARAGDFVRRDSSIVPVFPAIAEEPAARTAEPGALASARSVFVFRVIGAPRIVAENFDMSFARTLRVQGARGRNVLAQADPALQKPPSPAQIRGSARGVELAVVPLYVAEPDRDRIRIEMFDPRTGEARGEMAQEIDLFPGIAHSRPGKSAGILALIERYSGFPSGLETIDVDTSGAIFIAVRGDLFRLSQGRSGFIGASEGRASRRSAVLMRGAEPITATVEPRAAGGTGERVVLWSEGQRLSASPFYGRIHDLAASGDLLAILYDDRIDILRLK